MNRTLKSMVSLSLFIVLAACGNDNASAPLPSGKISGIVAFVGAEKPDGQVQVRLWRNWPTSSDPGAVKLIGNANGEQAFEMTDLPLGTFAALTVDWIADADVANNRVIGVFWADSDSVGASGTLPLPVQPQAISLTADNPNSNTIRIKADHSLVD